MPKPYRHSPAALALARAGIAQRVIADRLGYAGVSSVSDQLRGTKPPHPDLFTTIKVVGGTGLADEVAGILGAEVSA